MPPLALSGPFSLLRRHMAPDGRERAEEDRIHVYARGEDSCYFVVVGDIKTVRAPLFGGVGTHSNRGII